MSSLHTAIKDCITSQGLEVIKSVRMANILADYSAYEEYPATKQIVRELLSEGYGIKLYETYCQQIPWQDKIQSVIVEFSNKHGFKDNLVQYVFDCFIYGIGWDSNEPKLTSPFLPSQTNTSDIGVSQNGSLKDMSMQLTLLQNAYVSMLHRLISVPSRKFVNGVAFFSESALIQLEPVENQIIILTSSLGIDNPLWCISQREIVLEKYRKQRRKQILQFCLKIVLPVIAAMIAIFEIASFLASSKELRQYNLIVTSADSCYVNKDYRTASEKYLLASTSYKGYFLAASHKVKALNKANDSAEIVVKDSLTTLNSKLQQGHYYDAQQMIASLCTLPLRRADQLLVEKQKEELDKVIEKAVQDGKSTLILNLSINKGKLNKEGKTLIEELHKVSPNDYWISFIYNKSH